MARMGDAGSAGAGGDGGNGSIRVRGALDRERAREVVRAVERAVEGGAARVRIDLSEAADFDSLGAAALVEAIGRAEERGVRVALASPPHRLVDYLALVDVARLGEGEPPRDEPAALARLGEEALPFLEAVRGQVELSGRTLHTLATGAWGRRRLRWDRVVHELVLVGMNALPIVALIASLMGIILALQAAAQLRQFGAMIYIADLVGVAITREIGPLLTGLVLAGRSGSAYTAEIGSMVVSDEIDAMRQMGIHPARYLLVPKIVALAIALPCLGILANVVGIVSGAVVTSMSFDIHLNVYLEETRSALLLSDVTGGLFKCMVFGLIIGTIACSQGMAVKGGSWEVRRRTTASVVVSIFYIIAADTFFTWLFHLT
jgi:phospholipid/cholesterol/gamma-HCH transport system permease protein